MTASETRRRIRFLLDGRVEEIAGDRPTETVLDWLRAAGRCGTKEGCAEGDCGACTVVLGELEAGRLRYRAVNACILFLPALDGRQLITVESLAGPDEALHPVQQAMVEHHGSQCGFCTPGFVMSIFALYHGGSAPDRAAINDALAGNLCRCTGYRPIIDAAAAACADPAPDRFDAAATATIAALEAIRPEGTLAVGAGERCFVPTTLEALAELCLEHKQAVLVAGGTDVGLWVTKQQRDLGTVILLGQVEALRRIEERDGVLEIGAGVTYAEAHGPLARHYPDLGELIRRLGSVQIRNSGTIGGNIANGSPIGDGLPALLALGASLVLRRGAQERVLPLDDFFIGYRRTALEAGELIRSIRVPLRPDLVYRCYKISKRFDQDISAVCGAFALELAGGRVRSARLAFGGMAAIPIRARRAEAALEGRPWGPDAAEAAVAALEAELTPIGDMRASAGYRRLVAANLLRKLALETATGATIRVLALEAAE